MTRIYQLIQQLETLTETIDAAQQRAGQMDAQFQPGSISVLKSKTDPTHPADGQLVGESDVTEGRVDSPVSNAIIHRLVNQRPALLARFGPEAVMAAVDEVAEWVGDVDEIGSSDVSGWVADVERYLRTSAGEGIAEANPNQQISRYNPDGNTYKGSANKMPVLDPRDPVHNADRFGPEHDEPYDQDDYDKAELKSILAKQMESLSKVQRIVIKARFYDDMTFDQIANRLDITKERVRQIEAAGLRKLLHSNRSNVLRAFAEQGAAEGKKHVSPSGVETNMDPNDDDYAINYGKNGLVSKFRKAQGVAEADRVDAPKPKGPNESDPWRQGWVAWFERNSNNPYEKGTAEHSKWKDGFDDAGLQPDYYNENSENTNTTQGQLPEAADQNQMDTPEFQQALANLKKKAAQGPSKVAWDPKTSRYRVVPVNDKTMKESVTKEDIITKLKSTLGDYLSDVAQAVRKDSDLKDPGQARPAAIGAVKTIMTDDGHEIRIHGNEDDGFRITIKNKDASAKFASLSEAEMAANLYCAKRRQTPAAQSADYVSEETKDACYHKVKSRYKVWPSAYASGALVQCRKKGAKNWGNKS